MDLQHTGWTRRVLQSVLALALSLMGAATARADASSEWLTALNQGAMEAYTRLDVEAAKRALLEALELAQQLGITGTPLAKTYMSYGSVLVGGSADVDAGTLAFLRGLDQDAEALPDPLFSTPEIAAAFTQAKQRFAQGERAEGAPAPGRRLTQQLRHTPAPEQLALTAIPIFVERGELEVASMRVAYRAFGMLPKSAPMLETEDGFSFLIPCGEVFEPFVDYMIFAHDAGGELVGSAGSVEQPLRVKIVTQRSLPAPALPGVVPPVQCAAATECPTGAPDCGRPVVESLLGQTCDTERPCAEGLACEAGICALAVTPRNTKHAPASERRFFVELGVGISLIHVGEGAHPDHLPSAERLDSLRAGQLSEQAAEDALYRAGWDCAVTNLPRGLEANDCAVSVKKPGFVSVPVLNALVGYQLTPRLDVAATARVQLQHGQGPLAATVLGGRLGYLLTTPRLLGLRVSALVGAGVGSLQAKPASKDRVRSAPFASSANLDSVGAALEFGARGVYQFSEPFGVSLTVKSQLGLPHPLPTLEPALGALLCF
jgi:hypothetical protein